MSEIVGANHHHDPIPSLMASIRCIGLRLLEVSDFMENGNPDELQRDLDHCYVSFGRANKNATHKEKTEFFAIHEQAATICQSAKLQKKILVASLQGVQFEGMDDVSHVMKAIKASKKIKDALRVPKLTARHLHKLGLLNWLHG